MRLLSSFVRFYLIGLAAFVTLVILTGWARTGRMSFAVAWTLWNNRILRVAALSAIALILLDRYVIGERGGWIIRRGQPEKDETEPGPGSAEDDTAP